MTDSFCEITDVEALLQLTITGDATKEASCAAAIIEATEVIRLYTNQIITQVEDDVLTIDFNYGRKIILPQIPVTEVSEVVEDGTTLTAGEDYALGQHGILHQLNRNWKKGIQIIVITYTHGYSQVPQDIKDICKRIASRIYQAGLRSAKTNGISGLSGESIGDYSYSLASEQGGGVGEGILGASASRSLLRAEKELLDRKYTQRGT